MKLLRLITVIALSGFMFGCAPNTSMVRADAVLGTVLYSDNEYATLKTRKVSIDDLAVALTNAQTTKLGPRTQVEVQRTEEIPIASDVAAPIPWPFQRVRVASGPAAGREGWVSAVQVLDGQPILVPVPNSR